MILDGHAKRWMPSLGLIIIEDSRVGSMPQRNLSGLNVFPLATLRPDSTEEVNCIQQTLGKRT